MQKNSQFTFAVSASGNKWCEVTCMIVPDVTLDTAKYCQHYRIWEINMSMVFTGKDDARSYDHKLYYMCCVQDRWLIGDLINQHFALVSHPLLDRTKLKILEHYPQLVNVSNAADDTNANSPFTNFSQNNVTRAMSGKRNSSIEKKYGE